MARSSKFGRKVVAAAAAAAVALGALVAVSSPATAADAGGVAAAKKAMKYLSTYPTKIPITVPLSKKPPKGKKVFYIMSTQPDSYRGGDAFIAAAKSLGWDAKQLTYPSNPADAVGLVQQAIQQGADYIAVQATDTRILQPGLDAARAANVPIFMIQTDAVPAGRANWIFSSVNSSKEWVYRGQIGAAQTIANSNGKANTLIFNVPSFSIFATWEQAYRAQFAKLCPSCEINGQISSPLADAVSGKATSAVIAYLRSHPEVNQIACVYAALCSDFQAKAAAAGINIGVGGIGMSVSSVNEISLKQIVEKTLQSGMAAPFEYAGWQVVDAMARYSVGDSLIPNWKSRLPLYLYTQANTTASSKMYAGPKNFTGQFKKLWRVS